MTINQPVQVPAASRDQIKVLHIVDSLGRGGMENGVVNIAEGLAPRGFSFAVVALTRRGELAERFEPFGPVESLDRAPGFSHATARRLRAVIRRHRPDVIHTHNLGPLLYTFLAVPGSRRRVLHGEHAELGPEEQRGRRFLLRRLLMRWPRALHTVSRGMTDQFTRLGLNPGGRMRSLVNGVDCDHYHPPADKDQARRRVLAEFGVTPAPDTRVAGIVGRFDPHKRHLDLLEALALDARADKPALANWHLLLIGDGGGLRDQVLAIARDHPAADRIHWTGFRPRPRELYQALDLLLMPSVREGLSNALLEAMACGVPCLSHPSCGAGEVIVRSSTGWICEMADGRAILQHWIGVVEGLAEGAPWCPGSAARERARADFSLETMMDAYAEAYGENWPETTRPRAAKAMRGLGFR